jgi:hypothetical protein
MLSPRGLPAASRIDSFKCLSHLLNCGCIIEAQYAGSGCRTDIVPCAQYMLHTM